MDKWLSGIYEGDEEALTKLINTYASSIRRFLLGMLKNEEDAKELAQETFLRFISHPQKFSDVNQMRNYLFQIAHNLAVTKATSAASKREELTDEFREYFRSESATSYIIAQERKKAVLDLLQKLPPQQRRVVILRNWEDMTFKEIANVLSLSEGAVKAHYFFALKKLKEEIERKGAQGVANG
ncbi:MAG: RNA polymerase sigma factor [Acidobacteria bacterium]|nr:RNA polymerase sigma factor [Acidobacteriota bacterium]